ncbi:uncharacterized protein N7477_005804 [Penicillium maclennaniae]|uniref:uncharacterized protein n=1 Tax=Penicillium maclennaniae TaxID=1343394 RepID=UPI0025424002|nr:uncharacterized protein N7477_005804 [Penicillium maclennaniae]KAJ5670441.1 hypothetical protein N7477_005804 [Penicillium maclennaniae]
MPRTLPWLLEPKDEARVKSNLPPRKRVKRELESDPERTPKAPPQEERRDFFRSCKCTPFDEISLQADLRLSKRKAPLRLQSGHVPPKKGLDHDDAWIMVEDEFYATAQTFTQHLHYAEYIRRKKDAKAQSAAQKGAIERPTDGRTPMSKELQRKKEAEAQATRQRAGVEEVAGQDDKDDTDDDDDDTWAGTHLHGLMTSPNKPRSLLGIHLLKSSTRAAAGFGQAIGSQIDNRQMACRSQTARLSRAAEIHHVEVDEETASGEDDDLDGHVYTATKQQRRLESNTPDQSSASSPPSTVRQLRHRNTTSAVEREISRPARPKTQLKTEFKSKVQMLFEDLDELPEPSISKSSNPEKKSRSSTATQRSEVSLGERNLESKESRYKDVPTFLV